MIDLGGNILRYGVSGERLPYLRKVELVADAGYATLVPASWTFRSTEPMDLTSPSTKETIKLTEMVSFTLQRRLLRRE